jgi:hypothetical protein
MAYMSALRKCDVDPAEYLPCGCMFDVAFVLLVALLVFLLLGVKV